MKRIWGIQFVVAHRFENKKGQVRWQAGSFRYRNSEVSLVDFFDPCDKRSWERWSTQTGLALILFGSDKQKLLTGNPPKFQGSLVMETMELVRLEHFSNYLLKEPFDGLKSELNLEGIKSFFLSEWEALDLEPDLIRNLLPFSHAERHVILSGGQIRVERNTDERPFMFDHQEYPANSAFLFFGALRFAGVIRKKKYLNQALHIFQREKQYRFYALGIVMLLALANFFWSITQNQRKQEQRRNISNLELQREKRLESQKEKDRYLEYLSVVNSKDHEISLDTDRIYKAASGKVYLYSVLIRPEMMNAEHKESEEMKRGILIRGNGKNSQRVDLFLKALEEAFPDRVVMTGHVELAREGGLDFIITVK